MLIIQTKIINFGNLLTFFLISIQTKPGIEEKENNLLYSYYQTSSLYEFNLYGHFSMHCHII